MITRADFRAEKAYKIIENALDRKLEFEAIVSANDEMAIAAMKALRDRNIMIPDQIAITGFDDIMSARYLVLPLTTVRQPTYEISKRAMEILLQKINKKQIKDVEYFKTRVIIRRSCGCLSAETVKAGRSGLKTTRGCFEADYDKIQTTVFQEMKGNKESILSKSETDLFAEVMQAFYNELCGSYQNNLFVPVLDKALRRSFFAGIDDAVWEDFISSLRNSVLPYFADQSQDLIKIGNMLLHIPI